MPTNFLGHQNIDEIDDDELDLYAITDKTVLPMTKKLTVMLAVMTNPMIEYIFDSKL